MGNCLPILFGVQSRRSDSTSSSRSRRSRSSSNEVTAMSFSNPMMSQYPPQNSAYVNQLYAANLARQRAAAGEVEKIDDAKRLRIRGLLEQIPADFFRQDMKSSECAICMIDFEVGERVRFLPCMHSFHQECVDDWLMRSFTCPSCLEPVDSTILSSLTAHTQQSLRDLACSPATHGLPANPPAQPPATSTGPSQSE